jgi:hypothetical protein
VCDWQDDNRRAMLAARLTDGWARLAAPALFGAAILHVLASAAAAADRPPQSGVAIADVAVTLCVLAVLGWAFRGFRIYFKQKAQDLRIQVEPQLISVDFLS